MNKLSFSEIKEMRSDLDGFLMNRKLRRQFQPKTINRLINNFSVGGAAKAHIGCGGGKTTIFMLALAWLFRAGKIRKVVIVAPTIVLTRQLEIEFCEMMDRLIAKQATKRIHLRSLFPVTNVSSDKPDVLEDKDDIKEANNSRDFEFIDRTTQQQENELVERLNLPLGAFFVCLPSFRDKFQSCVQKSGVKIDITVFDEYHNLISQVKADTNKNRNMLLSWAKHSTSRWFFSASQKNGAVMSSTDSMFGNEIINVKSSQLVKWGYLVPNLRITFVNAGNVRGISEALEKYFENLGAKSKAFYQEWAVIEETLRTMISRAEIPQAIMFGSKVSIMKELIKLPEFTSRLSEIVPGIKLYGIFGDTKKQDRQDIFEEIKIAKTNQPFLLMNHSVIKEGVDVTRFNCLLLTRGMSEIGLQQALGRVQRSSPGKSTAHVFIFIQEDNVDVVKDHIGEVMTFIHYAIGDIPVVFSDMVDEMHGMAIDEVQEFKNYSNINVPHLMSSVEMKEYGIAISKTPEELAMELFA